MFLTGMANLHGDCMLPVSNRIVVVDRSASHRTKDSEYAGMAMLERGPTQSETAVFALAAAEGRSDGDQSARDRGSAKCRTICQG